MEKEVMEILRKVNPEYDFEGSSDYIEDGLLDSFDVVTVVSEIEDHFGVIIDGLDVVPDNFNSVDSICGLIQRSKSK